MAKTVICEYKRREMILTVRNKYKKTDFGIDKTSFRLSEIIVEGELYMFFAMTGRYQNRIEPDGFVYECRCRCSVIPQDIKTELKPHVFVRMADKENYTYLGKGQYETRYNDR
jgi:hypothetical protein